MKNEEVKEQKKPRDYFKITDLAVNATKDVNPSMMDKLGVYRGPVFTAMVAYLGLNMLGYSFLAELFGMGLLALCILHKLLSLGKVKENLNTSIDSVVELTKEKLSKKKVVEVEKELDKKE